MNSEHKNIENNTETSTKRKKYSLEKKNKLANKIRQIKDKVCLRKILDIIYEENPKLKVNKDDKGMLMFFHNLNIDTYFRLEKYLKKVEKAKLIMQNKTITENSEIFKSEEKNISEKNNSNEKVNTENNNSSDIDYSNTRTRYRYSNKEKSIIKRTKYEKIINNDEPIEDNSVIKKNIFTKST